MRAGPRGRRTRGQGASRWRSTRGTSRSHAMQSDDSAVNHLRAPIGSLVRLGNSARLRVGPLVAEISAASADRLGLREGEVVVASFKATATRLLSLA